MPHGPVRGGGERLSQGGMHLTSLFLSGRLVDRRPHQRVVKPEPVCLDGSEAGSGRLRPVGQVDRRLEEPFRGSAQLGQIAVIECRNKEECPYVGVETVQPGREGGFESSRQRQRLGHRTRVESGSRDRELDQGQGVAGGLGQDPLSQHWSESGAVDGQ